MSTRHERLLQGTPSDPETRREVQFNLISSAKTVTSGVSFAARAAMGITKPTALRRPVASAAAISPEWRFDIDNKYVNVDSKQKTVILQLRGLKAAATTVDTILAALTANGVDADDISSIFKCEDQRQVQLTFVNKVNSETLLAMPSIAISEHVRADVGPVRSDYHEIRVHWVPDYIRDGLFKDVFSKVGKVISVTRSKERGGRTGCVRIVKVQADWKAIDAVPHLMAARYEGQVHKFLITIAGRPPLCLLCDQIGHVKRNCPRSPAAVAAREAKEAQALADDIQARRERAEAAAAKEDDPDSDSGDENDDEGENDAADSPATDEINENNETSAEKPTSAPEIPAPQAFADPPPPPTTPNPSQEIEPTTKEDPATVTVEGQFTDDHDATDMDTGTETQATTSWADEMDSQETQEPVELEADSDSMSQDSIPCAQPEKHRGKGKRQHVNDSNDRHPQKCVRRPGGRGRATTIPPDNCADT